MEAGRREASVFLDVFAKLRKATIGFVMSVRPHGTTRLPLDRFSQSLVSEYFFFSKTCPENSSGQLDAPSRFTTGKQSQHQLNRKVGETPSRSLRILEEQKISFTYQISNPYLQNCSLITVLTELSRLLGIDSEP